MNTAYIAFGSNLGDRRANVDNALAALGSISEGDIEVSSLWESAPADMSPRAEYFLNGVVRLETTLAPRELLEALKAMEVLEGRPRAHGRNRPRTMDLDIICIDDLVIDEADLVVPHPRARERRFVLAPLAELAPDLILPGESLTVRELLERAPQMEINRLSDNP